MMPSSHKLMDIENLTYEYRQGNASEHVLKGASLSLSRGEFVILAGPSGSGKSTLLSLIGALRQGQSGKLHVCGENLLDCNEEKRRKIRKNIGYVFQQHNLLGFLTAQQNVEMALEMFEDYSASQSKQMAANSLEQVGLGKHGNHYPSQLSVGQKQRVAIARSLVHQPGIILADEPTASLDGKTGLQIVELLHHMVKSQGCGALVVTHDNRIFDYADRIFHIEDGVIKA